VDLSAQGKSFKVSVLEAEYSRRLHGNTSFSKKAIFPEFLGYQTLRTHQPFDFRNDFLCFKLMVASKSYLAKTEASQKFTEIPGMI
jgi:hypothetical protein